MTVNWLLCPLAGGNYVWVSGIMWPLALAFRAHLRTHLSSLYFTLILFLPAPPPFCLLPSRPSIMHSNLNDHAPFIIAACWIQHQPPYLTSCVDTYSQTNSRNPSSTTFRCFIEPVLKILYLRVLRLQ